MIYIGITLSFVQEELRTAIKAEILYAAWQVHIAHADAEALNSAYVAKVDDKLMRQSLDILLPC